MDFGNLIVKKIDLSDSKDFWNTDEESGYQKIKADDGNMYKVWSPTKKDLLKDEQKFEKNWWYDSTATDQKKVANILAQVKNDIMILLKHISELDSWKTNPIAFGIYHTLALHNTEFEYLEMRPNKWGCLGLNKPKEITVIKTTLDNGKIIDYELGTKRNILLTLRNQNNGEIKKYTDIINLAVHELTHTTCNDVRWVPEWKGGNHRDPYPTYHKMMRNWASECGLKIS